MNKFAKDEGVTLLALIITIIVLLILSTLAIESGKDTIESSRLTEFTNELQLVQRKVNELEQKYKDVEENEIDIGIPLDYNIITDEKIKNEIREAFENADEGEQEGYRYFTKDILKEELGITNPGYSYLIHIKRRSVIALKGVSYRGEKYNNLKDIPSTLYNVEKKVIGSKPTFNLSDNHGTLEISNIQYGENIKKGSIYYGKKINESEYNWKILNQNTMDTSESIEVTDTGTWAVKIIDSANNVSDVKTVEVVRIKARVAITTDPSSVVIVTGTSATFTVEAEGYNLTYQWYKNTTNSNTGGVLIPGADDKSYTISTASIDMNNTYYYCVVTSNGVSNVDVESKTSNPAKLTVQN